MLLNVNSKAGSGLGGNRLHKEVVKGAGWAGEDAGAPCCSHLKHPHKPTEKYGGGNEQCGDGEILKAAFTEEHFLKKQGADNPSEVNDTLELERSGHMEEFL